MSKSSTEYLKHILDEAQFVLRNTKNVSYDEFARDEVLKEQ